MKPPSIDMSSATNNSNIGNTIRSPPAASSPKVATPLIKKRDTERELWRRSWGSGHSHSSCSLQSSTTNTGLGKDDFWAALQTNYNFIMDTNLLDSCREARGEIEGPVFRDDLEDDVNCCRKALFKPAQTHRFYGDPRLLRQWIKEMENRVAKVPSVTETKRLSIEQLQKLAVEHGLLNKCMA
uniref:Uncharacterized protein n=1 Tax=Anopheles culicifacies TaxID=139723 RepID=A0A182MRW0_9DIPT